MTGDPHAHAKAAAQRIATERRNGHHIHTAPETADETGPRFSAVRLSTVEPERVSWLWNGRIPLGKLITLDGDPDLGKSTLALTFAAAITTGGAWPDGTRCLYPGSVILLSAEDGLADTVRPRLDAAGADTSRVIAVKGVPLDDGTLRPPTLGDIEHLRTLVKETNARLIIIDVLMAYLPTGTDSHKDQDIRRILARLSALAEDTGCSVLLLRHLNKGNGDPMYRGGGSIGIVGAARAGMVVGTDPDDSQRRVLASVKNNLAPKPPSLVYRLVPDDIRGVARVDWVGYSDHDARDLLDRNNDDEPPEAVQWLEDYLLQEGRVRSRDAKDAGRKEGFSQRSIERAFTRLRVVSESEGFPRQTFWSLREAERLRRPTPPVA
jgi:hypothetical protein